MCGNVGNLLMLAKLRILLGKIIRKYSETCRKSWKIVCVGSRRFESRKIVLLANSKFDFQVNTFLVFFRFSFKTQGQDGSKVHKWIKKSPKKRLNISFSHSWS